MKVAKLVTVSFVTRVLVDENATDEEVLSASKKGFQDKLDNDELGDNLEEIREDIECPWGTFKTDYE